MEKLFSLHRHFKGRKTILRQSPYSIEKKISGIHEIRVHVTRREYFEDESDKEVEIKD